MLNKNMDLLSEIHKKQYSNDLKKMVELYSEIQTILKISESSFINLIRYDYSKKYITLHFMFSINGNGEILHESYLDKLPATSNSLNLKILNTEPSTIGNVNSREIKHNDPKLYKTIKYKGIEKIYFSNIYKDSNTPVGYIDFSYKDNYNLNESQYEEISRIIVKISNLL